MRLRLIMGLLLGLLLGCTTPTSRVQVDAPGTPSPVGTPTPHPTPTLPPTAVPGTAADITAATAVVEQFAEAVVRNDEIVALLVLSPSAQKVVAATNLHTFLGRAEQPSQVTVRSVRLNDDVATADCLLQYAATDRSVQLRLVRLEGQWRVDGRASD